jgi:hypothetical protein
MDTGIASNRLIVLPELNVLSNLSWSVSFVITLPFFLLIGDSYARPISLR